MVLRTNIKLLNKKNMNTKCLYLENETKFHN